MTGVGAPAVLAVSAGELASVGGPVVDSYHPAWCGRVRPGSHSPHPGYGNTTEEIP